MIIIEGRHEQKKGGKLMETWLPTLITETPEEGYNLAMTLARKAIGMI